MCTQHAEILTKINDSNNINNNNDSIGRIYFKIRCIGIIIHNILLYLSSWWMDIFVTQMHKRMQQITNAGSHLQTAAALASRWNSKLIVKIVLKFENRRDETDEDVFVHWRMDVQRDREREIGHMPKCSEINLNERTWQHNKCGADANERERKSILKQWHLNTKIRTSSRTDHHELRT